MSKRDGTSLLETLLVLAIIGVMLALLFPAVQGARKRALDLQCQNNLHQINLAIADYAETQKRLPAPAPKGMIGGWTIDILPFIDEKNLANQITPNTPIQDPPQYLMRQPRIFRCPLRSGGDETRANRIESSCYVFAPNDRRSTYLVFDSPLALAAPWASGPEMLSNEVVRQTGPHSGGFFFVAGFQNGVRFTLNDQTVR